jgi:hypothetical protein
LDTSEGLQELIDASAADATILLPSGVVEFNSTFLRIDKPIFLLGSSDDANPTIFRATSDLYSVQDKADLCDPSEMPGMVQICGGPLQGRVIIILIKFEGFGQQQGKGIYIDAEPRVDGTAGHVIDSCTFSNMETGIEFSLVVAS